MTHSSRFFATRAAGALALLAAIAIAPAHAQDAGGASGAETDPALLDECRALTDPEQQREGAPAEDLSERLARCDGVLAPPPAGDPDIIEPAPDVGTTPVIPPEAAPEQPPG